MVTGYSVRQSDGGTVPGPRSSLEGGAARKCELSKKLYIGNLPFSATEDELRSLFEPHGSIASVNVIMDRDTGRARGFAFVEMEGRFPMYSFLLNSHFLASPAQHLRTREAFR